MAYSEGMLEAEANKLSNQIRFVTEICDGDLVLYNKTDEMMIDDLVKRGYNSDPVKAWKLKQHKEAILEPDYDYLFRLPFKSGTKKYMDKLERKRDELLAELQNLQKKKKRETTARESAGQEGCIGVITESTQPVNNIGMEHLPIEAVVSIIQFLSAKDVSNCSAVNSPWRKVFNNDICWKKFYNRRFAHYLENTKCLVQPDFSNEVLNGPLPPPNKGKLCYLRENQLQNNLLCGRYERREFVVEEKLGKVQFYDNNYIYFCTNFQVEIWDVTNEPTRIITVPLIKQRWRSYMDYPKLMAKGEKLIVIQGTCVRVFNISLITKSSTFAYCFFFNKSSEFSSNITDETYIHDIFEESSSRLRRCNVVICGSYVIGIAETESRTNPVIHVWDMERGHKVKEYQCQGPWAHGMYCNTLKAFEGKRNVLVICGGIDIRWYNVYNLGKMKFLMEWESVKDPTTVVVSGNYVCKVENSKLQVVCYVDEQDILYPNTTMFSFERFIYNVHKEALDQERLLLSTGNKVVVLNMTSGVMDILLEVDYHIEDFTLFRGNYLAVSSSNLNSSHFGMYICHFDLSKASKQVVALSKKKIRYKDLMNCLAVNDVGSKIVYKGINNRLIIVTFL